MVRKDVNELVKKADQEQKRGEVALKRSEVKAKSLREEAAGLLDVDAKNNEIKAKKHEQEAKRAQKDADKAKQEAETVRGGKKNIANIVFNRKTLATLGLLAALGLGVLAVRSCDKVPVVNPFDGNDKGGIEQGAVANEKTTTVAEAPNKAAVVKELDALLSKYKLNEPGSAEKLYTFLNDGPIMNTEDYDDALTRYNALVIQSYYDGSTDIINTVALAQPNEEAQNEILKAKAAINPLITNPNRKTAALYGLNALAMINGYNDEYRGQTSRSHLLVVELYRNGYVIVTEEGLEKTTLDLKKVKDQGITATPYKLEGEVLFTINKLANDLVTEERTALMQDNAELLQEIKVRTRK